jgi:3D (Asp-Asp-Asp) domain-containing protein
MTRLLLVLAHLLALLAPAKHFQPGAVGTSLSVTAYCLTGRMADGQRVHPGAAAGNRWPFGTRLSVPGWGVVTVEDRIGHGSDLDLWTPSCAAARSWGRRRLVVEVVG